MNQRFEAFKRQLNDRLEVLRWRVVERMAAFQQLASARDAAVEPPLREQLDEFSRALYAELARFSAVCELLVMRISALDRSYTDLRPRVDRIEAAVLPATQR